MQPRGVIPIRRQQTLRYLVLVAFVAALNTSCSDSNDDISAVREVRPDDAVANQPVDAVFYETVAQCQQDLTQKQQAYQTQLRDFSAGRRSTAPMEPALKPEDCEAQMALALREHEGHAPVYESLEQCQAEGTQCTPATRNGGQASSGYYPRFGGTFVYPYDPSPDFVYFYYGGVNHRVYRPTTVYQGSTGNLITPYGRTLPHYQPGSRISVPQHTRFTAPARPKGTSGSGVIRGRSSHGFGSTYKATGRGGVGK
ncbi:DUF1190 domain-containing protein [Synechocystis sp. LKSZ1]|uniref:DUF1190 domain-containing protein n=1 Tax=Synechocystis sp. LKSZ1 TaxID=3144951 RepID=UPI00336BE598